MAKMEDVGRSLAPAVVLAVIVLSVFYTLRDFGPGSAARRFHEDLMSHNLVDLQRVCTEPISSPHVARLGMFLQALDESGANARLASMERSANEVDVLVLYGVNGFEQPFVWVVQKREIGWQVDPYQTLLANPRLQTG